MTRKWSWMGSLTHFRNYGTPYNFRTNQLSYIRFKFDREIEFGWIIKRPLIGRGRCDLPSPLRRYTAEVRRPSNVAPASFILCPSDTHCATIDKQLWLRLAVRTNFDSIFFNSFASSAHPPPRCCGCRGPRVLNTALSVPIAVRDKAT